MAECIQVMEKVLAGLARGECQLPLRQIMWLPDKRGALGLMPSNWITAGVIGLKAVTFFPGNEGTELDSHQGAVMLYDADRGTLLAVIDGTSITAIPDAIINCSFQFQSPLLTKNLMGLFITVLHSVQLF